MTIEQRIPNLNSLYQTYKTVFANVEEKILSLSVNNEINALMRYYSELIKFDAKLRLGMSVIEIELNDDYVSPKEGDLKECHLMLYKLADIWFSYEAFLKLYEIAFCKNLRNRKILWLDDTTNSDYSGDTEIRLALSRVNAGLKSFFNDVEKRTALKSYLQYCSDLGEGGQKVRLKDIADNISGTATLINYSHTQILSMTYAIRNNFAHNGEITVIPAEFSFVFKNKYLKVLYKYLLVITISATKITSEQKLLALHS